MNREKGPPSPAESIARLDSENPPRWVLCSGATHHAAPSNALHIGIGKGNWLPMVVRTDGLEESVAGRIPPLLYDLICIAAFILGADCATSRGTVNNLDNGVSWRRNFRFVIPVSNPVFWCEHHELLSKTIGFLSDDIYRFDFIQSTSTTGRQITFADVTDKRTFTSLDDFEEVMLFSGGMDSFAGAIDASIVQHKRVLLVSHRSSTKIAKTQNDLVKVIAQYPGAITPFHIGIDIHRCDEKLRKEDTQRSRSLLFVALAGAVAWLAGKRRIYFHENGIIGLNLPISRQVTGARATRTVHPQVMSRFAMLLSEVIGEPFTVENPYQWKTRADVAEIIRDAGLRDFLRMTRSCAHIRQATKMTPFCGVCSQCIDRQFMVRAIGMLTDDPEEMYEVGIFDKPLTEDNAVRLAMDYVSSGYNFSRIQSNTEFMANYGAVGDALGAIATSCGISYDQALAQVVELHQRHGRMVVKVLAEQNQIATSKILGGTFHPQTMLARVCANGLAAGSQTYQLDISSPDILSPENTPLNSQSSLLNMESIATEALDKVLLQPTFLCYGDGWVVGNRGEHGKIVESSRGMSLIATLLRHPGEPFTALELEAVVDGKQIDNVPGIGETLDREAKRKLFFKMNKMKEEEEQEQAIGNTDRATAIRVEWEAIEAQLVADLKPNGDARRIPPELEAARSRVQKAIGRAIRAIKKKNMVIGRHFSQEIKIGYTLHYSGLSPNWKLGS